MNRILQFIDAPLSELSGYMGLTTCSYCLLDKECVGTGYYEADHGTICADCLSKGKSIYSHVTEIGYLDKDGLKDFDANPILVENIEIPATSISELLKTPRLPAYQEEKWLVHCNDFMVFIGHWEYIDFYKNSPNGNGKTLFQEMTGQEHMHLWNDITLAIEANGITLDEIQDFAVFEKENISYHAFKCLHCEKLRGTWDMG
jgi:uncharacterized protein CbrC (UPF0167 family)